MATIDKAKDERPAAKKAQEMLQTAFRNEVGGFKQHIRTSGGEDARRKPLKELKIRPKIRQGNVPNTNGEIRKYYLNQLVLEMGKHGFILNHGADNSLRGGNLVKRHIPKETEYYRRANRYNLKQHDFIKRALVRSGVIPYLQAEIGAIRGYEVLQAVVDRMAKKVNDAQPVP